MPNNRPHHLSRRALIGGGLALPLLAPLARPALAQGGYPSRPVRVIVPWAPGGAVDTLARRLAQKLSEQLGQSFVVENKSGATGTIGAAEAARAAPDGHTLLAMDNTYAMLPYLFSRLPFDYETAFRPVTVTAFSPVLLAVGEKSPYRDLASLIAAAKREPEKLTYGTGGMGSAPHFATLAFERAAGVKLYHVPFRGAGEAVIGVLSGNVDLVILSPGSTLGNIRGGQLRPLAISGGHRVTALPELPTFAEAGLPGYGVVNWSGLAAPRGTPDAILQRLQEEAVRALAAPDMRAFIAELGSEPGGIAPDAFARLIREETARWRDIAAAGGIEKQ
ncbi:tripartite tricarboxylate transporter substrate binding protein [Pseudoroseomonas cervicalis]|uniref:Bug family tripartite tricarboxylate transporter substrate binding protein n=1 Tax=Teichococcus cervicalis TaxID=204525 RepID=UPI00277EE7E9|nr:tripartite tricarboxylate transporter substrate binding protein [Pseudoroseomonas cervicalis]MDQ1079430.1 tripartite-type tricarboxylate transporter receptor subunit TctC [Pseudoroseomonas cervicalis]